MPINKIANTMPTSANPHPQDRYPLLATISPNLVFQNTQISESYRKTALNSKLKIKIAAPTSTNLNARIALFTISSYYLEVFGIILHLRSNWGKICEKLISEWS